MLYYMVYHIWASIGCGNCDCTMIFLAWGPDKKPDLVLSQVLNNWVYFSLVWCGTAHSADCGEPIECWLCCESTELTLSILGGRAVVLNGVFVDTGVCVIAPLTKAPPPPPPPPLTVVEDANGNATPVVATPVPGEEHKICWQSNCNRNRRK